MSTASSDEEDNIIVTNSPSESDDSAVMVDRTDFVPHLDDEDVAENSNSSSKAEEEEMDSSSSRKQTDSDPHLKNSTEEDSDGEDENEGDGTKPYASQIVSINEAGSFKYHKKRFAKILSRIPHHHKIAIVSVVGAFRTGKSFLLSWFLRYLYMVKQDENVDNDDSASSDVPWYNRMDSLGNDGFDWRGGNERNTTGIWMWSHPHILPAKDSKQPLAVLLVDTQGMFDNETTMQLATSIFGFSTLLSSYQIYNVDKLIKEDNLQQLALFTEYARSAVHTEEKGSTRDVHAQSDTNKKPFQQIEFLVRDYQHWDDEEAPLDELEKSMEKYLETVISQREAKDLKDTRDQIHGCFQKVSCFGLCHPGFAVTKKKFTGDVAAVEELFLRLLDRYCQKVFSSLEPKIIHGRELTAVELSAYIEAYADIFTSGKSFPTAATMLEATAAANNTNAINLALERYREIMDRVAGSKCSLYHQPNELEEEHIKALDASLGVFQDIANFGSETSIVDARKQLLSQCKSGFQMYKSLNDSRNPLLGLETFFLPIAIALIAWISQEGLDFTCTPYAKVCKVGSEALSDVWWVVICFLLIVSATKVKQIKDATKRFRKAFMVMMSSNDSKSKKD